MIEDGYVEPMDTTSQQGSAMGQNESSKLPPVLANLMGNLSNSSRSPQATNTVNNPVAPSVNVQELLSSIMVSGQQVFWSVGLWRWMHISNICCLWQGASGSQSTEDLIKQPDFSDKIKQLLGSLQQSQNQNQNGPPPGKPSILFHCTTIFVQSHNTYIQ